MTPFTYRILLGIGLGITLYVFYSCQEERVPEIFQPRNNHEAYLHGLEKAGLLNSALGRDWQHAAKRSIEHPQRIKSPHQEVFYLSSQKPDAQGYIFSVKRGQKIEIDVNPTKEDSFELFMDLYRFDTLLAAGNYEQVASADQSEYLIGFEPRQDGDYILRIQSELLRGGTFNLQLKVVPALRFPVQDKNKRSIGSFFGDPRDGGRRKHHGIDIFAKRHTPILAPTDGYIRFVGERGLGGQVVWMRDHERDMTLYFAHLQTILAEDDTWVKTGDTLGTVGNTGNARTTPPHLHFGIYRDGPIDPFYFVAEQPDQPDKIRTDILLPGKKIRTRHDSRLTLQSPENDEQQVELNKHQLLHVKAALAKTYRVELPDGKIGTIAMREVETLDLPIVADRLPADLVLLESPAGDKTVVEQLVTSKQISVLAKDNHHYFVRSEKGVDGWIQSAPQ